jgi:hypothetical protein
MDESILTYGLNINLHAPAAMLVKPETAFELLTPGERAAADFTQTRASGIEQEKIPAAFARERLQQAMNITRRISDPAPIFVLLKSGNL